MDIALCRFVQSGMQKKILDLYGTGGMIEDYDCKVIRSGSDIDLVVSFDGAATSQRYFGVQFYLEDLFGCPVDLVTDKALRPELRPYIEREAVNV